MNAVNSMLLINAPRISGTIDELCKPCRCRRVQLEAALAELKSKRVGNITQHEGNISIECRRLLREHNRNELKRKAGLASAAKRQQLANSASTELQNSGATPSASASVSASSDGIGVQGKGPRLYPREIKMQMDAKERQASELKIQHCSEVALGEHWSNQEARQRYRKLRGEIRVLNGQLANYQ